VLFAVLPGHLLPYHTSRMSLGKSPTIENPFLSGTRFCEERVPPNSIYSLLYREGHRLFPDEAFADLFADIGRESVPPRIVSIVMVLQRLEGLSDREAVERFTFDLRWKYAAGGLDYNQDGFVHTVLVRMRARLRQSERPNRIFDIVLDVVKRAGLVGRKRVLDSTPLYDAVATQDTVTLIRSAIRGLLRVADESLEVELRACCKRDDDYVTPGKPSCDWDDATAREALIDALACDAYAILAALEGRELPLEVMQAAQLLATVVGQDLEQRPDGAFHIARRVAKDRVISTVDPESRHGHKTSARGFDGYKGHIAIDPDSEIITASAVSAGNVADGDVAEQLVQDVLGEVAATDSQTVAREAARPDTAPTDATTADAQGADAAPTDAIPDAHASRSEQPSDVSPPTSEAPVEIYGDSSYGTAAFVERIEAAGAEANVKVQPATAPDGRFAKDHFQIDLEAKTVLCPAGRLAVIRPVGEGGGIASFGKPCGDCPLRSRCTDSKHGRTIHVHPKEGTLQRSRRRQHDKRWKDRYRATRPKVERKLGQLMQRRHGGRRTRVRGRIRIAQDFALLTAAHNLKRLATLGVRHQGGAWTR
jgi:hypothetical protein